MPTPFFEISCLEHVSDESQKSLILNAFMQDIQEHVMRQAPKTVRDITLDEPMDALPSMDNVAQGCMTPSPWAKPMRLIAQGGFEVSVKELAHHFLHHL
jgi:hypothetical protein